MKRSAAALAVVAAMSYGSAAYGQSPADGCPMTTLSAVVGTKPWLLDDDAERLVGTKPTTRASRRL